MDSRVKLIIWDLDGVLWEDSLSETGTTGKVNYGIIDFIRTTESAGIIHSVCSKNVFEKAKEKLQELGIWELFVFPKIEYSPKHLLVKEIINSCQLQEEHTLFVDDNIINLNEVQFYCQKIKISSDVSFISQFEIPIGKSRTSQYRILEKKSIDKIDKDNLDFLKESNIHIALYTCQGTDIGMEYFDRVQELVNRSNQLNFTNSRINIDESYSMPYANYLNSKKCYVFAWDKYGYYGLIGFFAADTLKNPIATEHFVFSCRIMHMGIENLCSQYIKNVLGWEQKYDKRIENDSDYSYITIHDYNDVRDYIRSNENLPTYSNKALIAFETGCQTATLIGFSKLEHLSTGLNLPLEITYEDILKQPDLIVMNANKFLYDNLMHSDIENYIKMYAKFIRKSKKKSLLLIPKILKLDSEILQNVYKTCMSIIDNEYVFAYHVHINENDYAHWNRKTQMTIALQIREWVLSHMEIN